MVKHLCHHSESKQTATLYLLAELTDVGGKTNANESQRKPPGAALLAQLDQAMETIAIQYVTRLHHRQQQRQQQVSNDKFGCGIPNAPECRRLFLLLYRL